MVEDAIVVSMSTIMESVVIILSIVVSLSRINIGLSSKWYLLGFYS